MIGPVHLDFRISNVGKGSATNVEINFVVTSGANIVRRTWVQTLLTPNQFQDFAIPVSEDDKEVHSTEYFRQNNTRIQIWSKYKDILGNSHSNVEEIDVSGHVEQFERTHSVYAEEMTEKIARNIGSISERMNTLTNKFHQLVILFQNEVINIALHMNLQILNVD